MQTFLHLSDIHIGDVSKLHGGDLRDPRAEQEARRFPHVPGNFGHSTRALKAINKLYRTLRRDRPKYGDVSIIVTGDVTAFGAKSHFENAHEYLRGAFRINGRHSIGLRSPTDRGLIPGNHDYFAGVPIPIGRRTMLFDGFFTRPLPDHQWTIPLPGNRQLRFLEIDCDHDFEAGGSKWPRMFARSSGLRHLQALRNTLTSMGGAANESRILLMHGSARYRALFKICELMPDAAQELDEVCAAHRIKAILCGHTHHSDLGAVVWPSNPPDTVELCCGTSAQEIRPQVNWFVRRLVRRYMPKTNQVLVHRLTSRSDVGYWETTRYELRYMDDEFQQAAGTTSIRL